MKTLQQELIPTKKPFFTPTNNNQSKFQPRNTPLLLKPPYNPTNMTKNNFGSSNTTKMMSRSDFDEMKAKGICFWCDDKYEFGHKCRKNQLYLVTSVMIRDDDSGEEEDATP